MAEVEVEDPWLSAALRQWEAWLATAQAQDPRRDYEVALAALQTISFATHAGGAVVTPEQAAAFLGRAVPWIPRSELHRAIELLVDGQQDEHAALLRAVRAATGGWLARAEARPAPRVRQAHGPTSAEAGEAWIEQNLAFWSYSGIDAQRDPELAVNTLLGLCTSSFALARQAGVSSPLTAEVALRFLERAWPAYDRASMRTLARVLADGHDDPELKALLTGLAAALGA